MPSASATRERIVKSMPAFETKVVDADLGIVEAIVNVTGLIDLGGDVIMAGAFAKTITERSRKMRVLNSHKTWDVLSVVGVCLEAREVGRNELPAEILTQFPEASGGLWTKTQYLLNTPEGRGVFERIKAGALDEYSIGFEVLQDEYKDLMDGRFIRIIKEVKMWEYSPVIWGMNQATATTGVKSDFPLALADNIEQFAEHLANEQKAGRVLNSTNAEKLRGAAKTLLDVLESAGIPLDSPDTVETEDDSSKAQAGPQSETPPAPTPIQATVTEEQRKRLLALIELDSEGGY
jgi:uncharacterized protein